MRISGRIRPELKLSEPAEQLTVNPTQLTDDVMGLQNDKYGNFESKNTT